jgi:serine/threonine-protein kinase
VLSQDPASPSQLNARVPRDLETICLKCLHKEPPRRYASAAALADDLRRYLEGRPIQARPLGWGGRFWRWGRRNPAAAALVVAALLLVGMALGGGWWLERQWAEQQAETARQEAEQQAKTARQEGRESQAVEAVLQQAADLQKQGRWPEARAVLEGAPTLLGPSAPESLRQRVRQAIADADMVAELEGIRLRLLEGRKSYDPVAPTGDRLYPEAFRKYGIALPILEPAEAAARIRNSAIRETLLAFLHDWLFHWVWGADRDKLRAVLDQADDDDWRRRLRQAWATGDDGKVKALMGAPEASAQPPGVLPILTEILIRGSPEEARTLLHEAQKLHPEDFWINFQLGYLLQEERPQAAVGYLRVAVGSRPRSGQAHTLLGRALRDAGDSDGAIAAFRKAIQLNPNRAGAKDLAKVLAPRGALEEARAVWEQSLESSPPDYDPWDGYAALCAYLDNQEAYRRACKALLERFQESTKHWTIPERTSLACLLLPASGEDLRRAVALADRAVALGPKYPHPDNAFPQLVKGLAEYRQGRPEKAVPLLQESATLLFNRASPRLALALAQFKAGFKKEARKNLALAVRAYNWEESQATHSTAWVSHVLRREAEALILPNLSAFLRDSYQPQDNDERLALLGICQAQGLYGAAARLYADAFAADPDLAEHLTTQCRYRAGREQDPFDDRMGPLDTEGWYLAARCAALAGCGRGKDGAKLSDKERTHWRKQARAWLRADLVVWARTLDSGSQKDRSLAKKMLTHWQVEPDLAGLREPDALDELSADERKECFALWDEVRVVLKRIARQGKAAPPEPKHQILIREGRLEEARVAWQKALQANPLEHSAWFGYAELCLFLGQEEEYGRARQALLARFGTTIDPYIAERTGRTCLLLPATGDELGQAVALTRRAAAADRSQVTWAYPWFVFAQGLAEYRQGRFDQTIALLQGEASLVPPPFPRLVLAMALHRSGQVAQARKTLTAALLSYDWRATQARNHDVWIPHVLRRETEGLILPNLPAFLKGKYKPEDKDERLALLAAQVANAEFQDLLCAAAQAYADAFAADAKLAEAVPEGVRYHAARIAALAGCGQGKDADKLDEKERARWRRQALDWLRQDLTWWGKAADKGNAQTCAQVRQCLRFWQTDDKLAVVRATDALACLPDGERKQWESLWSNVDALLRRVSEPE